MALFQTAWFVESMTTQVLVIFVIRTRRTPFTRSSPSRPLLIAALTTVAIGIALPQSPLAPVLGFARLPVTFLLVLLAMVVGYLLLVDAGKRVFYAEPEHRRPRLRRRGRAHAVHRRAAHFSTSQPVHTDPSAQPHTRPAVPAPTG